MNLTSGSFHQRPITNSSCYERKMKPHRSFSRTQMSTKNDKFSGKMLLLLENLVSIMKTFNFVFISVKLFIYKSSKTLAKIPTIFINDNILPKKSQYHDVFETTNSSWFPLDWLNGIYEAIGNLFRNVIVAKSFSFLVFLFNESWWCCCWLLFVSLRRTDKNTFLLIREIMR